MSLLDFDFATNPNPAYSANRKHLTTRLISLQVWGCCDALDQFGLGAYEHGFILGDQRLYEFSEPGNALHKAILDAYPTANILAIVLHSYVNLYGYDIYERGKRIRFLAGSANDGVIHDFGELQPEEKPIFAQSSIVDGERIFKLDVNGSLEKFDMSCTGESLVFAVMKRYLGYDFYQFPDDGELQMQLFSRGGAKARGESNQAKSQANPLAKIMKFFGRYFKSGAHQSLILSVPISLSPLTRYLTCPKSNRLTEA